MAQLSVLVASVVLLLPCSIRFGLIPMELWYSTGISPFSQLALRSSVITQSLSQLLRVAQFSTQFITQSLAQLLH